MRRKTVTLNDGTQVVVRGVNLAEMAERGINLPVARFGDPEEPQRRAYDPAVLREHIQLVAAVVEAGAVRPRIVRSSEPPDGAISLYELGNDELFRLFEAIWELSGMTQVTSFRAAEPAPGAAAGPGGPEVRADTEPTSAQPAG